MFGFNQDTKRFEPFTLALPESGVFSESEIDEWEKEVFEKTSRAMLDKSGIPEQYKNGFESYFAETEAQKKFKAQIIGCFEKWLSGAQQTICLLGTYGIGKTHISCSFLAEALKKTKRQSLNGYEIKGYFSVKYILSDSLLERYEMAKSYSADETQNEITAIFSKFDLLVIDEVGRTTERNEGNMLYKILDARDLNKKTTILCSNLSFEEFSRLLGGAAMDRLKNTAVFPSLKGLKSYRGRK